MKQQEKPFFYEYIWLFVFGCILGFIIETLWHFIKNGIWINKQGLVYGPFKPIYGFGLVLLVLLMYRFKNKKIWQKFVIGTIIGSTFEYFGSLFQEIFFGTSTWNYSTFPLNIGGRLFLPYCFIWGIFAILCIDYLYPVIKNLFMRIPKKVGRIITIIVGILMFINIILTVLATIGYSNRTNGIENTTSVMKKIDELYPDEFMQKHFPKLKVVKKDKK